VKSEEEKRERANPSHLTPHASRISLIVAMAKNGVIGADNRIPWHLPGELQIFKRVTMGHHIIMGRRTWESINRLLPGRTTVIVTRQSDYRVPGAMVVNSLDDAIARCRGDEEIFVIGGADLFKAALPIASRLYLTTVDVEPAGDIVMPPIDWSEWCEATSESYAADERNPYAFRYAIYDRAAVTR
jgi:dihydrofolate reductase